MRRYAELLAEDQRFIVPDLEKELTTGHVLAMTFIESRPIESVEQADQATRDKVVLELVELVLRELFEFGVMQTDPNFANYRVTEDGRLVLLDFGAAQDVPEPITQGYRTLLGAALANDKATLMKGAVAAGFIGQAAAERHPEAFERMIDIILAELHRPGPFNFGDRAFLQTVREEGMRIAEDKASWHLPPADLLFVQRKISGTALLAARMRAKVDVRGLVERALG